MRNSQREALERNIPTTEVIRDAVTFPRDRLGEPIDYCPGHGDLSNESLQEASIHINGEIDRILPLLEEQIAGAYLHEPVTLSVGDARLLVAVLHAELGMEKALGGYAKEK